MQDVGAVFTAEAQERTRKVAGSIQVAWKRGLDPSISLFTIGVSTIGGDDVIAGLDQVNSDFNKYQYFDESEYLRSLSYDRELVMPAGGVSRAIWDASLDNTTKRFTPSYMGGESELFTAILPRRPVILNAGFNYDGIDHLIPQMVGVNIGNPIVDRRTSTMDLIGADMMEFLSNRFVDQTSMFTGVRTDELIETILQNMGYSTAQYDLDTGINLINFAIFRTDESFLDIMNELVKAEAGHLYQNELGVVKFENRQHWDSYPYTVPQAVLFTSEVLESSVPNDDHIINTVEVIGEPRQKEQNQEIWNLSGYAGTDEAQITTSADAEIWANYNDPILEVDTPVAQTGGSGITSYWVANTSPDGDGTDVTSNVSLKNIDNFAEASKFTFSNNSSFDTVYLTELVIYGRPARRTGDIYYRESYDSSVTAYDERVYRVENPYIQSETWAESLSKMILEDFAQPESLQTLTIKARPELQLGDLVSWQGRYWRLFGIKTQLDPNIGFIQDVTLLQREIRTYFRIGISLIGGSDVIAP